MNLTRSWRPVLWLLTTLALIGGALVATSPAARAADEPTLTVQSTGLTVGGKVAISGTGWTVGDGSSGSTIEVKIDDGAYSHIGSGPHANKTVWAIIQAGTDGSFSTTITLPTAANSTPAFAPGTHSLRFLTGSLKTGDVIRSMSSGNLAVAKAASTSSLKLNKTKIKKSKKAVATVQVKSVATPGPTGAVKIYNGKKVIKSATLKASAKGTIKITLPKLKKGTHKIKATYVGNGVAKTSTSKVIKLKVTK